ncbi:MAG: peptidase S41, partial [Muribaculaceae bacterium]|nr:peptidase S41 [Muribaculaceae bacterium]
RGEKNTTVEIGVKRSNTDRILTYKVTRGDIPVKSVDAAYMVDKTTGYIKVNQFGRTTYDEFITALATLQNEGALRYIVDLRGNGGGFMEMAILMVNEFLPSNKLIVYTKGRYKRDESQVWSDGYGSFKDSEVVVLIDEFSASASEIFAGAMQDNDRGLIVGCRSFGKGLVQRQYVLADSTGIRLTIARYYTPSGRCIQKDYKGGDLLSYDKELIDRYNNGEIYSRDSIKIDKSKKFLTEHGRTVYGGGGIIPDIFVAKDTSGVSPYYIQVFNANLMQEFALKYYQLNKNALKPIKDYKQLLRVLNNDEVLLNDFANFAAKNNVPPRWHYINQSRNLLLNNIKALIGRNLLGQEAFYPIVNKNDKTIEAALKALNSHKAAFPIVNKDDK